MSPARILPFLLLILVLPVCAQNLCGDCNLDGTRDVLDALVAAQVSAAIRTISGPERDACDVDSDLSVDILDALAIAQCAAGLPCSLSCTFPPPPATLDIQVTQVVAYENLMPIVPPDPLIVYFEATYTNLGAVPAEAVLVSARIDVTPPPPDAPFSQDLLFAPDRSGLVPVGGSLLVAHNKTSGSPPPPIGGGVCQATGELVLDYDVGGTPVHVTYPGIPLSCVY